MKASDFIAEFLYEQGVRRAYEVLGGMTAHLIDSLYRHGGIQIVSMHHEQSAAFAAEAEARITGVPGVAIATSGPGATNLLTGVGSCYFDSVPAVFITGQVNRHERKGSRAVRQLGFQETDIVPMASPITKAAWQIESPEEVPRILQKAFALARCDRPGPVLVDLPMDIQRHEIAPAPELQTQSPEREEHVSVDPARLFAELASAQRPLILAGGGIRASMTTDLFRAFVDHCRLPVVHSLMAVDVLPYRHPLRVGMIGTYGNRWANMALGRCDFLLVLGSRLDIRQTGADTKALEQGRTIYHVDCELGEINNRVQGCRAIAAHLRDFFTAAAEYSTAPDLSAPGEWLAEIAEARRSWPDTAELQDLDGVNPNAFMHELGVASQPAAAFIVDVGQHQMWAAQSLELGANQRFLTSGGMGAMGFALPAAIGTSLSRGREPVVMVAGDGGFQVNIHELETIVRNDLPIKMVIVNNRCYGMVRQFQQSYFDERYQSSCWGYSAPDFARVADAYGISSSRVQDSADVDEALKWLWKDGSTANLLELMIETGANVYPKIAFGYPITQMEPLAQPVQM